MKKRVSAGFCLLLCSLVFSLGGCGSTTSVPEMTSQDAQSQEVITAENTDESAAIEGDDVSGSEVENPEMDIVLPESIAFGSYPQQSESAEPIEWLVVDQDESSILILSKYCLASLPWNESHEAITWDKSDIRAWLNGEFLDTAFSEEEKAAIIPSDLETKDDLDYGTAVGENTKDAVFLLSASEALEFLKVGDKTVSPTSYAIRQGAYTNGEGHCAWWLRSPGMTDTSPAYFASSGEIGSRAHEVDETIIGVRPAIRVDRSVIAALENDSDGMPEEAATLYDWFLSSNHASDVKENTEITATGVVTYIGTDIHGLPSFRLSDSADGNCYVHACLASSGGYGNIKVGDEITVKGTSIYSVMNGASC